MDAKINLQKNLQSIQAKIADACKSAGRNVNEVRLIAVSKTKPWSLVQEAYQCGQVHFGENYVQEGLEKIAQAKLLKLPIEWHFIGHLQTNKVKSILGNFSYVHSLDRLRLAETLNQEAEKQNIHARALVQVNLDGEATKGGLAPEAVPKFLETCSTMSHLEIMGFMCIPDPALQKANPRAAFARLRELRDQVNAQGTYPQALRDLSMGMTADFPAAIAEGSTMIRVGTAIFGEREKK